MPFSPQPLETVLYPSPFIPTEHHKLVISTQRLVQYSPDPTMTFPVAEFPLGKIDHVARMSERSSATLGIVSAVVGFIFLIVFAVKVLPAIMYAGSGKTVDGATEKGSGDEDSGIEGRDQNDEDPFANEKDAEVKDNIRDKANKKLKKIKEVSFGIPPLTEDVVVGLLSLLVGAGAVFFGRSLYGKEEHAVFCRVGEMVYKIEVDSPMQQTQIVATLQAAREALPKK